MRLVTKINLSLVGVVAVSAAINFAALNLTVMPSFLTLEAESAERNQSRVLEAIKQNEQQVAGSAGDYGFWDDTYKFVEGSQLEYVQQNVTAESLQTLGVNYFAIVDNSGKVVLDKGFDRSGDDPVPTKLIGSDRILPSDPLLRRSDQPETHEGLVRSPLGLVALGYAPILRSDRTGPPVGTLIFGRLLDLDELRSTTKVDFTILASGEPAPAAASNTIALSTTLTDPAGSSIGTLITKTRRDISGVGTQAIWAAMAFLLAAGALLIIVLAFVLRRIAVRRIERMRTHLVEVANTGELTPMPEDKMADELSDTLTSFNAMTVQLADLREKLRRQDYQHGAAEQTAGLLHNVRNAMSPIASIAWDLAQAEAQPWRKNLETALEQLRQPDLPSDRAGKLSQFVSMSASKLIEDDDARRADLKSMASMLRHVDDILKDHDVAAQAERPGEVVDLASSIRSVARMVERRPGITLTVTADQETEIFAPKTTIEQILANLMINAAESIEASGGEGGSINVSVEPTRLGGSAAVEITVHDTGEGIDPSMMERIFERGFSTRKARSGGLGLHWCANAANALGGRLSAKSDGRGLGASFSLVLPIRDEIIERAA